MGLDGVEGSCSMSGDQRGGVGGGVARSGDVAGGVTMSWETGGVKALPGGVRTSWDKGGVGGLGETSSDSQNKSGDSKSKDLSDALEELYI